MAEWIKAKTLERRRSEKETIPPTDEVFSGVLEKKSRGKSRFLKSDNVKSRVFVLTKYDIRYYTGTMLSRGKMKGRIMLSNVRIADPVNDDAFDTTFQVVEETGNDEYLPLYINTNSSELRDIWVEKIRSVCNELEVPLFSMYHSKEMIQGKDKIVFPCCGHSSFLEGCTGRRSQSSIRRKPPAIPPPSNPGIPDRLEIPQDMAPDPPQEFLNGTVKSFSESLLDGKPKWYYPDLTLQTAKEILQEHLYEGCYVIRPTSNPKYVYSISLVVTEKATRGNRSRCKIIHYHIFQNDGDKYTIDGSDSYDSVDQLVAAYGQNRGGLPCRLRYTPAEFAIKLNKNPHLSKDFEVKLEDLEFREELGKGEFGVVSKVIYKPDKRVLAAKTMKIGTCNRVEFIKEAEMMSKLKYHPNISGLLGFCEGTDSIYLLSEYMEHGSLKNYLRCHKLDFASEVKESPGLFTKMLRDIAKGMSFLHKQGIIHRDLAARNCLVGENELVKVADFGLARVIDGDEEYNATETAKVPIKWVALEVLEKGIHSQKSDIWSYGIVMWEIYALGETPYAGVTDQVKFLRMDKRLDQPSLCPNMLYKLMLKTWNKDSNSRPSFNEILDMLNVIEEQLEAKKYMYEQS